MLASWIHGNTFGVHAHGREHEGPCQGGQPDGDGDEVVYGKGKEEVIDKVFGLGEFRNSDIRRSIQKSSEENAGLNSVFIEFHHDAREAQLTME